MFEETKTKGAKAATKKPVKQDDFLKEMNEPPPPVEENRPRENYNAPQTQELTAFNMNDLDFVNGVFDEAEGKKSNELSEVTAGYLDLNEFKKGEERTYMFTAMTTFTTNEGEVKPAVVLMDRERANYICASTVIVTACRRLDKLPAMIRLQVNGKVKGKNGDYFDVKVFVF